MIPTLGNHALDQWQASVAEKQCYENGRWHRRIVIRGAADTFESNEQLTNALDTLATAILAPEPVLLRLRPDRSIAIRLRRFEKTCHNDAIAGAFTLELESLTPWEEGDVLQTHEATITENGIVCEIVSDGSLTSPLSLTFTATGMILLPRFSDGVHTLLYSGILQNSSILEVDSIARKVYVDAEDVSSQISGDFPEINPQTTTFSFEAEPEGTQTGILVLSWRERWL